MAQTFFIDSDEEIISVIGQLRKSSDPENYFVFPKRSLVLQSAVNLRLFQREAEKQGKKIIIVSQDETGRQLAERVGIPTKDYAAEIGSLRQEPQPMADRIAPEHRQPTAVGMPSRRDLAPEHSFDPLMPTANRIGSDSFAATSGTPTSPTHHLVQASAPESRPENPSTKRLKIRDTSPRYQTALNSKSDIRPQREPETMTRRHVVEPVQSRVLAPEHHQPHRSAPSEHLAAAHPTPDFSERNQKLQKFFNREAAPQSRPTVSLRNAPGARPEMISKPSISPERSSSVSSWKTVSSIVLTLLFLSGAGAAVYFLVPKATVVVTPHDITRDITAKYEGRTIAPIGDKSENVVPVRKIEKSYTTKVSGEATGKSSAGNQKARGTIIISNEYSSDSQPLISTTRFEAGDGKIFRLAESVTVPGMTIQNGKREAGVVEAVVVADEAGDAYNINPTSFTVPGFKGSAKYDKFRAQSTKAFTGGGAGGDGIANITKEDIDKSIQKLKELSKEEFLSAVKQDLLPEERIIEDSAEIREDGTPALPLIGSIGESFDVEQCFDGKIFVVSEQALKDKLAEKNQPELKNVTFAVIGATLSFENVVPHYDENTVEFSVQSALSLESVIMKDALREELLGQDEKGIKMILEKHPEIKKIEVNFTPEFLFRSIPNSTSRVSVILEKDI